MKLLLDTNVYFGLLFDSTLRAETRAVVERAAPRTFLTSIVLAEMLQGARGDLARFIEQVTCSGSLAASAIEQVTCSGSLRSSVREQLTCSASRPSLVGEHSECS